MKKPPNSGAWRGWSAVRRWPNLDVIRVVVESLIAVETAGDAKEILRFVVRQWHITAAERTPHEVPMESVGIVHAMSFRWSLIPADRRLADQLPVVLLRSAVLQPCGSEHRRVKTP